jgi:hypothetical protein
MVQGPNIGVDYRSRNGDIRVANTVNQVPRRTFTKIDTEFNQHYSQMVDTVNTLLGYYGDVPIRGHINMQGNKIMNAGVASDPTDVLSLQAGDQNYSAPVMRAKLEANGTHPLQSVRRMNDTTQREQNTSWLKTVLSTAPSANNVQVLFSTIDPTHTQITIPASLFHFADGEIIKLTAYTLPVTNPGSFTIAASPGGAAANGITAAITTTTAFSGITPGSYVTLAGVADAQFNGTWVVSSITSSTSFTFPASFSSLSGGGTVTTSGIWYFYATHGSPIISSIGLPASADSPYTRMPTSTDQRQLIAVAAVNANGGVAAQSAGGGTPASVLVLDAFQDGVSGLITVRVTLTNTVGQVTVTGPQKVYAIDPDTLVALWTDLPTWLAWVKSEHLKYQGIFQNMLTQLMTLKGTNL